MKSTYTALLQSKFFNPAFNSAIFDGPIRIYFSQSHEAQALKIYFQLQQNLQDLVAQAKESHRHSGQNILVLLYPNNECFQLSFEGNSDYVVTDHLDGDPLIGINGPFDENQFSQVLAAISHSIQSVKVQPALESSFV